MKALGEPSTALLVPLDNGRQYDGDRVRLTVSEDQLSLGLWLDIGVLEDYRRKGGFRSLDIRLDDGNRCPDDHFGRAAGACALYGVTARPENDSALVPIQMSAIMTHARYPDRKGLALAANQAAHAGVFSAAVMLRSHQSPTSGPFHSNSYALSATEQTLILIDPPKLFLPEPEGVC